MVKANNPLVKLVNNDVLSKEKMDKIATFLSDILEAREKGKSFWWRWLDRFASYFDRKFGPDWREKDKEFWEKFPYWMFGE